MIMLTAEEKSGLGIAMTEATLLGAEVNVEERLAAVTLAVFTLPEAGPVPQDRRLQFLLQGVGRVAASLRLGRWDDPTARVEPFTIEQLLPVVQSFGGCAIYGWEFIDRDDDIARWADRLSLDWCAPEVPVSHSVLLFQEGRNRHLDLAIWFQTLRCFTPAMDEVALTDVIAGGKRWWDAFYADDPRTRGLGIMRLR